MFRKPPHLHVSRAIEAVQLGTSIRPAELLTCDGETIVVNRHGALISSTIPLRMGLTIEIHVTMTDKKPAKAKVVYVDAERPFVGRIALDNPENIWGLSFPPDDWYDTHET